MTTGADWEALATKDLKRKSLDTLTGETFEGIPVKPLYTAEDTAHLPHKGGFPGLARKLATEVLSLPENALRIAGLAAIAIGVGIVWLVRGG